MARTSRPFGLAASLMPGVQTLRQPTALLATSDPPAASTKLGLNLRDDAADHRLSLEAITIGLRPVGGAAAPWGPNAVKAQEVR